MPPCREGAAVVELITLHAIALNLYLHEGLVYDSSPGFERIASQTLTKRHIQRGHTV
jgi:hypothetical protein